NPDRLARPGAARERRLRDPGVQQLPALDLTPTRERRYSDDRSPQLAGSLGLHRPDRFRRFRRGGAGLGGLHGRAGGDPERGSRAASSRTAAAVRLTFAAPRRPRSWTRGRRPETGGLGAGGGPRPGPPPG